MLIASKSSSVVVPRSFRRFGVARSQTRLADVVGNVQYVEQMIGSGALENRTHPQSIAWRVPGEVEDHWNAAAQQCRDVRSQRRAQPRCPADIVLQREMLIWVHPAKPNVFTNQDAAGFFWQWRVRASFCRTQSFRT